MRPDDKMLAALKTEIGEAPEAVRPLRLEGWLALAMPLVGAALLALVWMAFGLRQDAGRLGAIWLWGPSLIEFAVALLALTLVLRQAIPGRSPGPAWVAAMGGLAMTAHLGLTLFTRSQSPTPLPPDLVFVRTMLCVMMEVGLSLPFAALAIQLLSRGLVTRPLLAGIGCGVGAGVGADAVWRMVCPYEEPAIHLWIGHTGGVLVAAGVGLCCVLLWDRQRCRAWRKRRAPDAS